MTKYIALWAMPVVFSGQLVLHYNSVLDSLPPEFRRWLLCQIKSIACYLVVSTGHGWQYPRKNSRHCNTCLRSYKWMVAYCIGFFFACFPLVICPVSSGTLYKLLELGFWAIFHSPVSPCVRSTFVLIPFDDAPVLYWEGCLRLFIFTQLFEMLQLWHSLSTFPAVLIFRLKCTSFSIIIE